MNLIYSLHTSKSVVIKSLVNHFVRHGIPGTLRTGNGSNPVRREMEDRLDELKTRQQRLFHFVRGQTETLRGRTNLYIKQCVRHKLKGNYGDKGCKIIFLHTGLHLTPQLGQHCLAITWKENWNDDNRV